MNIFNINEFQIGKDNIVNIMDIIYEWGTFDNIPRSVVKFFAKNNIKKYKFP